MKANSSLVTGGYGLIGSELTNTLKGNVAILTKSNKNQSRVTKVSVKTVIKNILDIKRLL